MNTVICAGGSSQRVLTSILHLCAAGLGPEELRILVVDPDGSNGNGAEMRDLVEQYVHCHERFAPNLGPGLDLFRTKLDLLDDEQQQSGIKVWSPVKPDDTLATIINYDNLPKEAAQGITPDVAHLFFTDAEVRMKLDRGFMGHTAVGAAAMSLVGIQSAKQPWKQVVEKIKADVSTKGSNVVIIGSVFGGTGASAIYPLLRFLRGIPETNRDKLHVAAAVMTPYFRFDDSTATPGTVASRLAAQSQWFPLRTRSAVDFYELTERSEKEKFDAVYWVGDSSPMPVDYAEGGPNQKNPSHYVDLLAALATLEYLRSPEGAKGNYYAGSRIDAHRELGTSNVVDWRDLPLRNLTHDEVLGRSLRLLLAGSMHTGFFQRLFETDALDARPSCVRWYYDRFAKKGDFFSNRTNRDDLTLLDGFFHNHHLPWWSQITSEKNVFLFNHSAFQGQSAAPTDVQLDRVANLYGEDRPSERSAMAIDRFVEKMDDVPSRQGGTAGVGSYLSLLTHAAELYMQDVYKMAGVSAAIARSGQ